VVTGILFYLAIERIVHKDFELDATVMLITSAVGVAVNLVLVILINDNIYLMLCTDSVWRSVMLYISACKFMIMGDCVM
jgi:Co/Zn/Cd efflux system component